MSYFYKLMALLPWDTIIKLIIEKFGEKEKVKTLSMSLFNAPRKTRLNWLHIAYEELGVMEIPGRRNERRIIEYHASTSLKASEDSVPWCSSFVCWVMEQAGYPSTRNARARSWLEYGVEIPKPIPGCIVVFWRKSPDSRSGHVAFYVGDDGDKIKVLGGNQSNQVKVSSYPKERVLGYFLPE